MRGVPVEPWGVHADWLLPLGPTANVLAEPEAPLSPTASPTRDMLAVAAPLCADAPPSARAPSPLPLPAAAEAPSAAAPLTLAGWMGAADVSRAAALAFARGVGGHPAAAPPAPGRACLEALLRPPHYRVLAAAPGWWEACLATVASRDDARAVADAAGRCGADGAELRCCALLRGLAPGGRGDVAAAGRGADNAALRADLGAAIRAAGPRAPLLALRAPRLGVLFSGGTDAAAGPLALAEFLDAAGEGSEALRALCAVAALLGPARGPGVLLPRLLEHWGSVPEVLCAWTAMGLGLDEPRLSDALLAGLRAAPDAVAPALADALLRDVGGGGAPCRADVMVAVARWLNTSRCTL